MAYKRAKQLVTARGQDNSLSKKKSKKSRPRGIKQKNKFAQFNHF